MSSQHSRIPSNGDPRSSNHSIDRATGSEYTTTGGASSRLSNVATFGNAESPPPLPTTHNIAMFAGPDIDTSNVETVKRRARPLSLANSLGPENGPLSQSSGSLPLDQLHRASSEMLSNNGATTPGSSHLASLSSRAFLAPMSSQQLQMHRNQRPVSQDTPNYYEEDGRTSAAHRNSTGSGFTIRTHHALPTHYDTDTVPSDSRATSRATSRASERSQWAVTNDVERDRDFREFMAGQQQPPQQANGEINGEHGNDNIQSYQDYISHEQYIPDLQNRHQPQRQRSFMSGSKRDSLRSAILGPPAGHLQLLSAEASPRLTTMDQQRELVKENLGRNYEYFTGNTKFFWGGRLQNARDRPVVLATALIIIIPAILFFIFSAPWLWHNISPAIPITFAYLFYICMSSFIHASVTNPGILPRNLHPFPPADPTEDPLALGPPTTDWVMVRSATAQHGAFEVPTKYCKSCNIWRPPRCHHCRVCDNCIETQDHHCLWLNNCVGRRNYRYFFTFIATGTLLALYLLGASVGHIWAWKAQNGGTSAHAINSNRVPFAMFIYGLLALGYPLPLWGYHTLLISRGQTTREYLNSNKFAKGDRHRPFDQRPWWRNFVVVLGRPRPPTFLNFKEAYVQGDQRFGTRREGGRTIKLSERQQGGVEMQKVGDDGGHTNGNGTSNGNGPSFQGPTTLRDFATEQGGVER